MKSRFLVFLFSSLFLLEACGSVVENSENKPKTQTTKNQLLSSKESKHSLNLKSSEVKLQTSKSSEKKIKTAGVNFKPSINSPPKIFKEDMKEFNVENYIKFLPFADRKEVYRSLGYGLTSHDKALYYFSESGPLSSYLKKEQTKKLVQYIKGVLGINLSDDLEIKKVNDIPHIIIWEGKSFDAGFYFPLTKLMWRPNRSRKVFSKFIKIFGAKSYQNIGFQYVNDGVIKITFKTENSRRIVLVDEELKALTSVYIFWDKADRSLCLAPTNIKMENINKAFNSQNTPFLKKIYPNRIKCGDWNQMVKYIIHPNPYDLMD